MTRLCLDSWAVLRWLEGDHPASTRVEEVLGARPLMSWINVAEVFYITARSAGAGIAHEVVRDLRATLELDLPTIDRVLHAAAIKADHPMALADAFAVATAVDHDAVLLTGDPEIIASQGPWHVEDLRGPSHPGRGGQPTSPGLPMRLDLEAEETDDGALYGTKE